MNSLRIYLKAAMQRIEKLTDEALSLVVITLEQAAISSTEILRLKVRIAELEAATPPVPEIEVEPPGVELYHVGQRFLNKEDIGHAPALFAQTGPGEVNLVDLKDGNRYKRFLNVQNCNKVPKKDFHSYFGEKWTPIV